MWCAKFGSGSGTRKWPFLAFFGVLGGTPILSHFWTVLGYSGVYMGIYGIPHGKWGVPPPVMGVYFRDLFWTGVPIPEMGILHGNRFESVVPILFPNVVSETGPDPARGNFSGETGTRAELCTPGDHHPHLLTHSWDTRTSVRGFTSSRGLEPAGLPIFSGVMGNRIRTTL